MEFKQNKNADDKYDSLLLRPLYYISELRGKQLRRQLAQAFNVWYQIPDEKLSQIISVIEILHNASLLIDDVEDGSVLRRGIPSAHNVYGTARTINAANFAYFLALRDIQRLGHAKATDVYCRQLIQLHRGQGLDIYWREQFICPLEEEYKEMVINKTGGLFRLAIDLISLFSEHTFDFVSLTCLLGLLFQIRDDYCNFSSTEYAENKTFAEDLTEGKFNFVCVHAINSHPEDDRISEILRQRPRDIEVKKYCISIMKEHGSFDYTRRYLSDLDLRIREEIRNIGCENVFLEKFLDTMRVT